MGSPLLPPARWRAEWLTTCLLVSLGLVLGAGLPGALGRVVGLGDSAASEASATTLSSCDTDVAVRYGTEFAGGGYVVTSLTVADLETERCADRTLTVRLRDGAGNVLSGGSARIPNHGDTVRVPMAGAPLASATWSVDILLG